MIFCIAILMFEQKSKGLQPRRQWWTQVAAFALSRSAKYPFDKNASQIIHVGKNDWNYQQT